MGKLILLSDGLSTEIGRELVRSKIDSETIKTDKIILIALPKDHLEVALIYSCELIGFSPDQIFFYKEGMMLDFVFDYIYVSEGNVFELLEFIQKNKLVEYIRESCITHDAIYIGSSAGAMIAGTDIDIAKDFDKNTINLLNLKSLGLFKGTIIPHYTSEYRKRYEKTDLTLKKRYTKIRSVDNGEVCVISTD